MYLYMQVSSMCFAPVMHFVTTHLLHTPTCFLYSVPEDCDNPTEALESFTSCFTARYGELHPLFFIGSLADAIKEAFGVPADQVL